MTTPNEEYLSVDQLPALTSDHSEWVVYEVAYDGTPLLVRYCTSAAAWAMNPDLSLKVGFAVPLNTANEGGMPDPEENKLINDIEDTICAEIDARTQGLHVMAISTGTFKEFVFYLAKDADVQAIHEAVQKKISTHEVQCIGMIEEQWDTYWQFSPEQLEGGDQEE